MRTANDVTRSNEIPPGWQPLLDLAVREVFDIMLGCKLETPGEPCTSVAEFTAMVGLAGQLCGLLTLRCSSQSAALIASRMLGVSVKEADAEMWDAIGEIANMVAGN